MTWPDTVHFSSPAVKLQNSAAELFSSFQASP